MITSIQRYDKSQWNIWLCEPGKQEIRDNSNNSVLVGRNLYHITSSTPPHVCSSVQYDRAQSPVHGIFHLEIWINIYILIKAIHRWGAETYSHLILAPHLSHLIRVPHYTPKQHNINKVISIHPFPISLVVWISWIIAMKGNLNLWRPSQ